MPKIAGSGRKKGVPNKATGEIKALAQEHGPQAIAELVRLVKSAKNKQARIAAAKEILDRGYGKATQPLANDPESPLTQLPDKIEFVIVEPGPNGPVRVDPNDPSRRRSAHRTATNH